jgi:hypothetical protein
MRWWRLFSDRFRVEEDGQDALAPRSEGRDSEYEIEMLEEQDVWFWVHLLDAQQASCPIGKRADYRFVPDQIFRRHPSHTCCRVPTEREADRNPPVDAE